MESAKFKKLKLENILKGYGKIIVAFSGGVDSTFLLKTAKETYGVDVTAVTLKSAVFPESEYDFAEDFCEREGIEQKIIEVDLLGNDEFAENHEDRCYTCKTLLFEHVTDLARDLGIDHICEGSIADDDNDYRPGKKAIKELGILSPMKEADLTKNEIRFLSREMGLPTWDKPSMACLASRIPYGKEITDGKLRMVEQAEEYLTDLGFHQIRVRIHDDVARIETDPVEMERLMADYFRDQIYDKFREIGFSYVALDMKGYRTGSLNEFL